MILWLILFLLVIAISFILAYQSMRDFQEVPAKLGVDYSLYLVRNSSTLTPEILESIHDETIKEGLILSIERLFKGRQSALVIFGPKIILQKYQDKLNLLELEDYTKVDSQDIQAWEVGVKDPLKFHSEELKSIFRDLPQLSDSEQFWWQLLFQPDKKKSQKVYRVQIRAVVFSPKSDRRLKLAEKLVQFAFGHLIKIPKPFTSSQIFEFYRLRSLTVGAKDFSLLTSEEIINLSKIS